MNQALRSAVRRYGPSQLVGAWTLLGPTLGPDRRRLLVQPVIALTVALVETLGLVAAVRLILLLVEGGRGTSFDVANLEWSLSFAELGIAAIVACAATAVLRLVEARYTAHTVGMAVTRARSLVIDRYFAADWEQTREGRLGTLQQLIGTNSMQAGAPVQLLAAVSLSGVQLVVFILIIVSLAPPVALFFAAVAGATSMVMQPLHRAYKRRSRRHASLVASLQLSATSYAHLKRELTIFGVTDAAAAALREEAEETGRRLVRLRTLTRLIPGLYHQLLIAGVVLIVIAVRAIEIDATAFGTAAILGMRSLGYVQQLNSATVSYLESRPFLDDLAAHARSHRATTRKRGDLPLGPVRSIALSAATYEYPDGTIGLDDVTLHAEAGEWIGIVGPSGAGKTTLANLLAGLTAPTRGSYVVNDQPMEAFSRESWAAQFAIVSQEPTLLRATVAENIAFHRPATFAEIEAAASLARVKDEIEALPRGFDTPVGEGGAALSGGQRQRIAIARALLRHPTCLLLDEPSSALDEANEVLIDEALAQLPKDAIVFIISHRPRMLERCHRRVELDLGRVR